MSVRSGNIDALRGFAILFVIQFHLFSTTGAYETIGTPQAVQRVLAYGWVGVDLFFVLSAYLLTRNLARQEATPSVIGRFYLRRAFRILPLYWVVLAAGFALMYGVKATRTLRVSEAGELEGLDIHEHGAPAYHPEFAYMGSGQVGAASAAGAGVAAPAPTPAGA